MNRVLERWNPEDAAFWAAEGRRVARLNLWVSAPALFLAFAVWQLWSVVAPGLPALGFALTTDELFWLAAAPGLSGASLRVVYSFVVPLVGGRRWTALSTASLLLPVVGVALAVREPTTGFPTLLALALLCGLGGGNFSSSMANLSHFFPKARQGAALGLNGGLGNLGVSAVQALAPLVVAVPLCGAPVLVATAGGGTVERWPQNAAWLWAPPVAVVAVLAWLLMHDLAPARASLRAQWVIFRRPHTWLCCWLYLGTFGSFIGFAAGFPLLAQAQFPAEASLGWAWLGPLLGAAVRPLGGWLGDRLGGARVTLGCFVAMGVAVAAVLLALPAAQRPGSFPSFFAAFLFAFAGAGLGSGSTFRMIPVIFHTEAARAAANRGGAGAAEQAAREGSLEAAAVLGFAGAVAAYGGFFIPRALGASLALTGGPALALGGLLAVYATCLAVLWGCYARRGAPLPC